MNDDSKHFLVKLLGLIAASLLVVMLVIGRAIIAEYAPDMTRLVVLLLAYALVAGALGVSIHKWRMGKLEAERYRMQTKTLRPIDANYPVIYDDETKQMIQAQPGVLPEPQGLQSLTFSPHNHQSGTRITEEIPAQLPPGRSEAIAPPDLRSIVEELRSNTWEFAYGGDTATGQLIKTALPKAVHIQLLGASGQGKSRAAQSIIGQLVSKNDAEHFKLALIDCEGETTRPFHRLPHVSHLAEDEREAAHVLSALCDELPRRDVIAGRNKNLLASLPIILLFVEEFLNLRRTMPESLRDDALENYTTLALRGRKRGMFLFAIGQTAYTEKAIRDAQLQFLSSMAFAIKPSAARSAGFTNTELLNRLYDERRPGQFLLERPAGDALLLAPYVDPSVLDDVLTGCHLLVDPEPTSRLQADYNQIHNQIDAALQAKLARVLELHALGAGKGEIIKDVWNVAPSGRSKAYDQAQEEYAAIMRQIVARATGQ